jgi:tape measure domain-containing protein
MAGSLASINIRFKVALGELSTQLQNAARIAQSAGKQFQDAGRTLTLGLTAGLLAFGLASVKTSGDLEALKKGLTSVTGSALVASAEFENLKEVAKLPGLGLEEAVRGSVNLQAAGFSALEAKTSLEAFGNALATVGKGARELDLVVLALTQLNNKTTGFGQDLRQLTEQLPQLRGALTAAFGTSDSEAIAKTGVTGKQVVQLLTKEFAKLPKVTGGINNAFENLRDSTKISMAGVGEALNKAFDIEGLLESVGKSLQGITERFQELSPNVQKNILKFTVFAAAIGPVLLSIGALLKVMPLISLGVKGIATAITFASVQIGNALIYLGTAIAALQAYAIPIAIALGAIYLAYKLMQPEIVKLTGAQKDQVNQQKLLTSVVDEATRSIISQKARLQQLVYTAKNDKLSLVERKKAMQDINNISPKYLGNITLETINTDKATEALNKYNEALLKGAIARAAQTKLDELAKKQVEYGFKSLKGKEQEIEANKKLAKSTEDIASLDALRLKQQSAYGIVGAVLARAQEKKDKKEIDFLTQLINSNKEYLGLLEGVGDANAKNADVSKYKAGTIAFYEEQIKSLQKLQKEFETTPEGVSVLEGRIEGLQKKIDKLSNVKVKVTSVFEGIERPDTLNESQGTTDYYDRQITALRKIQNEVATTSSFFRTLEESIAELELDKAVKFDIDVDTTGLDSADESVKVFGQKFAKNTKKMIELSREFSESVSSAFKGFVTDSIEMFGELMGNLATGKGSLGGVLAGLSSLIADFVINVGKSLIAVGVAGIAFQNSLTNPYTALVTGAIVVAVGSAFKAAIGSFNDAGAFANGGIVGGSSYTGDKLFARVNSGEMILNKGQQNNLANMLNPAVTAKDMIVQLVGGFEIEGSKLKLVLDRTNNRDSRIK